MSETCMAVGAFLVTMSITLAGIATGLLLEWCITTHTERK